MPYIIALDSGTSSSRAILVDEHAEIIAIEQTKINLKTKKGHFVEQSPMDIHKTAVFTLANLVTKNHIDIQAIKAIGITNQRETTILWNRSTGKPVYPAIVWNDRRKLAILDKLQREGKEALVQEKTGLSLHPYFSAGKIWWILQNVQEAKDLAQKKLLCFGTVNTWILWNITGKTSFFTDYSNAARTLLFNTQTLSWDKELCSLFGIPEHILPEARPCNYDFGKLDPSIVGKEIPIYSIMGDQSAALYGHTCFDKGSTKVTFGTGAFLLSNTKEERKQPKHGLISSIAWGLENQPVDYMLEGAVFSAGSSIAWIKDSLGLILEEEETEGLAYSVTTTEDLVFIPTFHGIGPPLNIEDAKAVILGLSLSTNIGHIVRALLEGISHQIVDIVEILQHDFDLDISTIKTAGGMSHNTFLMQTVTDFLQREVVRAKIKEASSIGVAFMAGLKAGVWKTEEEIRCLWKADQKFSPDREKTKIHNERKKWKRALSLVKMWQEKTS